VPPYGIVKIMEKNMSVIEAERIIQRSAAGNVKEEAKIMIDRLPNNITWDELQYRLYVCQVVDESDKELEAGLGVSHEEAKRLLKRWLK
jgi:hypothetical protein